MKTLKYTLSILFGLLLTVSCSNNDNNDAPGKPVMTSETSFSSAMFGDSLAFKMKVSDEGNIPLSTLKAQLYFGDELVSSTTIRTKSYQEYAGKIYIPFYKSIPNGKATLKFVLQNIHFTKVEQSYSLALTRPDYDHLTLVTEKYGNLTMTRVGLNQYSVTGYFDMKVKGYIQAPAMGSNGNVVNFGWEDKAITQGSTSPITFTNTRAGQYTITFNTLTYEGSPFLNLKFDGQSMTMADENNYYVDKTFTQGQTISTDGIDLSSIWIDPDFFKLNNDGTLTFVPVTGEYKVTLNYQYNYLRVEAMKNGSPASLNTADGSGAIWIIGEGCGKPSVADNQVGWSTDNALCMAQVSPAVYQATFVAGQQIATNTINFKFFDEKGWTSNLSSIISTTSDVIFVGNGSNGRDSGNLGIVAGKTLTAGKTYVFTVTFAAGPKAVLTVTEK